jgi:hypothetical protein
MVLLGGWKAKTSSRKTAKALREGINNSGRPEDVLRQSLYG